MPGGLKIYQENSRNPPFFKEEAWIQQISSGNWRRGGKVLNPWNTSWLSENSAIFVPVPTHSEDSSKTRSYYPGVVPLKWSGYPIFRNFNGDIQFPVFWLDHISIWIGKNTLVELIKIIFLLFWLSKTNENDKCVLSGPPPPWKLCWISKNTWYSANF